VREGLHFDRYIHVAWEDWLQHAACSEAHVDPDTFFPELTSQEKERIASHGGFSATERRAKAICARCPVQAECLNLMYSTGDQGGVWGGTLERERRKRWIQHSEYCFSCNKNQVVLVAHHEDSGKSLLTARVRGCRPVTERIRMLLEDMRGQAVRNGFVKEEKTA